MTGASGECARRRCLATRVATLTRFVEHEQHEALFFFLLDYLPEEKTQQVSKKAAHVVFVIFFSRVNLMSEPRRRVWHKTGEGVSFCSHRISNILFAGTV